MDATTIAERMNRIDSSGIRKVFDLAANLKDPVNLSIGQPDFDVPEPIKQTAIDAMREGRNKYTQTQGISALNEAVCQRYSDKYGFNAEASMITAGVSGGILLSLMALLNEGDEVLIGDPYFVIYKHIVNLLGARCVYYSTYPDFTLKREAIEPLITQKTKIIIINSPANPNGVVYSKDELVMLADVAKKHDLFVISDEIYDSFTYDTPFVSVSSFLDPAHCLVLNGFSKNAAMTGWRLGYALGPKILMQEMTKLQQYTFVCAPAPVQEAGLLAIDYDYSSFRDVYHARRDLIYKGLVDAGYRVVKPGGAFYIFPEAPGGSATEFVKKAIEQNLLIIPGNVFSEQDTHFRISYAAGEDTLKQGIEILARLNAH